MTKIEGIVYCDNCGVEITWAPYLTTRHKVRSGPSYRRVDYCCQECYKGYQCRCNERMELDEERRTQAASLPSLPF
jgi:hypothetical protein